MNLASVGLRPPGADDLGWQQCQWRFHYPDFHAGGAQGQIDEIMQMEDADIVIGIFWTRFGTAVADGQSGTEHELPRAYEVWKRKGRPHIMVYFNHARARPPAHVLSV